MKVIGLAGGIGAGKSEVSRILGEMGAEVLNADRYGHEVYLPGTDGHREVVEAFGEDVLQPNGEVDRRALGGKVFGNPEAMARLNAIAWPRIRQKIEDGIEEQRQRGTGVVVLDAAVLIEAGWTDAADEVWVVTAPEGDVVSRLQARNNLTEEQVRARMASQMSSEERVKYADVVVSNEGDLEGLQRDIEKLWEERLAG
ncbi:MAG: dephospho-CoA kinase [Chloroflexota bacterium]|nr:dephospho-CoA kinase [Chloroflexota bacterium]MDE2940848.1 dephospho-CoA kinase [Chloroflexota bacterium]MDE3267562.1 dephospho-CoA kinase [Chloroflexota bacterium]